MGVSQTRRNAFIGTGRGRPRVVRAWGKRGKNARKLGKRIQLYQNAFG